MPIKRLNGDSLPLKDYLNWWNQLFIVFIEKALVIKIWLMSQEDVACTQEIAKFIAQCMKLRVNELDILLITD